MNLKLALGVLYCSASAVSASELSRRLDPEYSMSMEYYAKSGKLGKMGKGGSDSSAKSGKMSKKGGFDECSFENPALIQAFKVQEQADFIPLEELIWHAEAVNEVYAKAVKDYIKGVPTAKIEKKAKKIGMYHAEFLGSFPSEIARATICDTTFDIINQMRNTCNSEDFLPAYVNTALIVMQAFAFGGEVLQIVENCESGGKTFREEFGIYVDTSEGGSWSPTSSPTMAPESYRRVLTEYNKNGKDLGLFDLMEHNERTRHLSEYEERRGKETNLGVCDYEHSILNGMLATHNECFHESNLVKTEASSIGTRKLDTFNGTWDTPTSNGAALLAANPGLWSIDNFLDESEMQKLEALVERYGYDLNMFGPCRDKVISPSNAHPVEGKECFKISAEHVCDGPYSISACDLETQEEDALFISNIIGRFESLWPNQPKAYPYAKFQMSKGGTPPMDLHTDNDKIITFVLYFQDGGAATIFPGADLTVAPKRGTARTWINVNEDFTRNPAADHAVQAHPASAGDRLVMLLEIPKFLNVL